LTNGLASAVRGAATSSTAASLSVTVLVDRRSSRCLSRFEV